MIDDSNRGVIERLDGYTIPLTMPMTDSLGVDYEGLARNTRLALELPGSCGVYFGSVYQEFWTLSMEERKRALEAVSAAAGDSPLIAGVSSTGLAYTLELAEHAESLGADMLMVWPPIFGDRDDESVFAFYEEVARTVSTPICAYSSTLTEIGFYIGPSLLARIAELPNVCAVKEASFNVGTHLSMLRDLGDKLVVSSPFEEYWLAGMALVPDHAARFLLGSSRAMYMQTPERPYMGECLEHARAGRLDQAYATLEAVRPLIEGVQMRYLGTGKHPIALAKYVTEQLGWAGGPVRAPIPSASDADRRAAREALATAGLVEAEAMAA